ncbi:hypothetical protein GGR58DRAFT_506241 [Xylaria digitata]|nr:hypothetical protein GGR58DRAFT_506241 [Xylaria digitata]
MKVIKTREYSLRDFIDEFYSDFKERVGKKSSGNEKFTYHTFEKPQRGRKDQNIRGGRGNCGNCGGHRHNNNNNRRGRNKDWDEKKGSKCYDCGNWGHIAKDCSNKKDGPPVELGDAFTYLATMNPADLAELMEFYDQAIAEESTARAPI